MNEKTGKLTASFGLGVIVIVALLGAVDDAGVARTDAAAKRAVAAFAIARGINGAISFAQGTEVAIQPAGVGLVLAPGEVLDPINDLVERFSWVMLMSSVSLGVQRLLITMGASTVVSALLAIALAGGIVAMWLPRLQLRWLVQGVLRTALVLALLRFAAPVFAVASGAMFDAFLADHYVQATHRLGETREEINRVSLDESQSLSEPALSVWDRVKRSVDLSQLAAGARQRAEHYLEIATDARATVVSLTVVFVVETVVFPLVFLWLILIALKASVRCRLGGCIVPGGTARPITVGED